MNRITSISLGESAKIDKIAFQNDFTTERLRCIVRNYIPSFQIQQLDEVDARSLVFVI